MKVLLIDENFKYIQRLTHALQQAYGGRYDIYSLTDIKQSEVCIREIHPDAVIVDKVVAEQYLEILPFVSAYFVNDADIEQIDGKKALGKYRSVDEIHQDILTVLTESNHKIKFKEDTGDYEITVFTSPAGGTGCSSLACAFALNRVKKGKRTLLLSLDPFENTNIFLHGNGKNGMSDLIYAIKSRSTNFSIKIETSLKKTEEGVWHFGTSKNALDMLEMTADDQQFLLSGLKKSGLFDCIVLDLPFRIEKDFFKLIEDSKGVFWVNDGRASSAEKIRRAYEAFTILGSKEHSYNVTGVINNKYAENRGYCFSEKIPEYGVIPIIENDEMKLHILSETEFFSVVG